MRDILFEWNPWWTESYTFQGIRRDIFSEIEPWIERKEILAVVGVRRAGKTTFLYEIIEHLLRQKHIPSSSILFIKADDDRIVSNILIDTAIDEYRRWKNPTEGFFLFIDEVQEIAAWEKTVKRLYDLHKNLKIILSGSNSTFIKEELSSTLAGRFSYVEIFPFTFKEFLRIKKLETAAEEQIFKHKNLIRNYLLEYITKGGFPEITLENREQIKNELAKFYFDSIFYRDVIKRKNIRNPAKMEKLVKYLLQNVSNLINFSKIAKLLELSTDSITEYVKALEEAYLLFTVPLFEFSYKKQIINPKKIYCVDTGIRNIVGFQFSSDSGRLYENIVFLHLRKKHHEIYYWKNTYECDFVVKNGKELHLIQVCSAIESKNALERETKALEEAMLALEVRKGLIITEDYEKTERKERGIIHFIPLWKWLLN